MQASLSKVDVCTTTCRKEEDTKAILDELEQGVGVYACNTLVIRVLREALENGHAAIREGLEARPWAGGAVARSIAWLTDEVVRLSLEVGLRWLHPSANPTEGERKSTR